MKDRIIQNIKIIKIMKSTGYTDKEIADYVNVSVKDFLTVIESDPYLKEVYEKAQEKLGFKAEVGVSQGIKETYLALKSGKVDIGPKTVTVQWYRNILEAKALLDSVLLDGRVI